MQVSRKTLTLALTGISILVLVAVGCGAILYLLAPGLVRQRAHAFLGDRGITVVHLEVDHVGLTGAHLGKSELSRNDLSLEWESVDVRYGLPRLARGKFDHLLVSRPVIQVSIPALLSGVESLPEELAPDYSLEEPAFRPGETIAAEPPPPVTAPSPGRPSGPPAVVESSRQESGRGLADIPRMLESLPFADGFAGNGQLAVDWAGVRLVDAGWDGHFVNDPERFNGELRVRGELLESVLTLQTRPLSAGASLFGEAEFTPGPLMDLLAMLPGNAGMDTSPLKDLVFNMPVKAEFLAELDGAGALQASGLVSTDSLDWLASGLPDPFRFTDIVLLGTHVHGKSVIEGGGRFLGYQFKDFSVAEFGIRFSRSPPGVFKLETETIHIGWRGWSGQAAVRGRSASVPPADGTPSRVELSFKELTGPLVRIQPASLLLQADSSSVQIEATAVGLERDSTLWIEDLAGEISISTGLIQSGFTWYSAAGARMGDVKLEGALLDRGAFSGSLRFLDPDGRAFLESHLESPGDSLNFRANGELSLKWLNALAKWWWGRSARLSGTRPSLELQLSRPGFLLKGAARLGVDSLDVSLPGGPLLKGISGNLRFKVLGLPRSEGKQSLRIHSVTTGNVRIDDVTAEFSLPTVQDLVVSRLTGKIGAGEVYLDEFSMDPLKPEFETTLRFSGVPAQQLLDWFGEQRFALQGTVTGAIPLRWKDGVLHVGQAEMRMDSSATINRFLFSDKAFLEEQFSSMKGVPADLKQPFLATLLSDGIRIRDLTLALVPYREKGEVALKLRLSGETRSESMEVPIESLIINNVISGEDLGHFLGLFGPIKFLSSP